MRLRGKKLPDRIQDLIEAVKIADRETYLQWAIDLVQIALHDRGIMGKDTFGPGRMRKICQAFDRMDKDYEDALGTGPRASYCRGKMDEELKRIYGDVIPFEQRYRYLKELKDCEKPNR